MILVYSGCISPRFNPPLLNLGLLISKLLDNAKGYHKMKDEEFKNKITELTDFIIDSLTPLMFTMAFLPCLIWLFMLFVAYMFLFRIPIEIIKNIYNKLVDIFRR